MMDLEMMDLAMIRGAMKDLTVMKLTAKRGSLG